VKAFFDMNVSLPVFLTEEVLRFIVFDIEEKFTDSILLLRIPHILRENGQ